MTVNIELPEQPFAYRPDSGWDEMTGRDGEVRPHWRYLIEAFSGLGGSELERRRRELERLLHDDGATYHVYGEGVRRPWTLDPVPLLIDSDQWRVIEEGLSQRAELLELVARDLYGPRELMRKGLLPPEVIHEHPGFLRACDGAIPHGGQFLPLCAMDVARDDRGDLWVLADRTQAPSGAGYALENRIVMSRVFPSVFRDSHVHRLAPFFRTLRAALAASAPEDRPTPLTVILTPGPWNETYFEHGFLASYLGFPLVQGSDLEARDGALWLRSVVDPERVDVILRRIDDDWCDPLELRPESALGVPGLVEMARRGRVAMANPLGAGALENPGLAAFLPALARHLLGQDLRIPTVPTMWCGDRASRAHALQSMERFVFRPLHSDSDEMLVGSMLSSARRDEVRRRVDAHPQRWVAQEFPTCSTSPVLDAGRLVARPTVLRTFAVAHEGSYMLLPGGLTRVANNGLLPIFSNQTGATSKDTWVLASEPESQVGIFAGGVPTATVLNPAHAISSRVAENLFWLGRYAERAENTVRLTRVILDRRSDAANRWNTNTTEALNVLLITLTRITGTLPGFAGEEDPGSGTLHPDGRAPDAVDGAVLDRRQRPEDELRSVLTDVSRKGSLAFDVGALLSCASAVRDQLSLDTWLVLNTLEEDLQVVRTTPETAGFPPAARVALGGMMKSFLALSGLVNESMVRDPGWCFLDAGRRIERATLLIELMRSTVLDTRDPSIDVLVFESLLTTAESVVTFRRRSPSRLDAVALVDLLLLEASNPRSLTYQLDRLAESLLLMPHHGMQRPSPEERPVAQARTRLAAAGPDALAVITATPTAGVREELAAILDELSESLSSTARAIAASHFPPPPVGTFLGFA